MKRYFTFIYYTIAGAKLEIYDTFEEYLKEFSEVAKELAQRESFTTTIETFMVLARSKEDAILKAKNHFKGHIFA